MGVHTWAPSSYKVWQKDQEFKAILGYTLGSRVAWAT
jgi:hypothetical protein